MSEPAPEPGSGPGAAKRLTADREHGRLPVAVVIGLAVLLVVVVGLRLAWSQFLGSDALRAEVEAAASAPLAKLYPGARVLIGKISPYGLLGAELTGVELVSGPGANGKTPNVPTLTVRVHTGPGSLFSQTPRVGFEAIAETKSFTTGTLAFSRKTGDVKAVDARLFAFDLATWIRPRGVRSLVLTGRAAWLGGDKPMTFAGRIETFSANVDLPGVAALPPQIRAAVKTFSVFRDTELDLAVAKSRLELVKPLLFANQGGKIRLVGGMLLAKRPPEWDVRVELEMPPLVAGIVAKGLLRCKGPLAPGAKSFQMSGSWEAPLCR